MNIKSLLLGSAAALVAATGARAADAIVIAEPEPMEYVRICDMYGVGFFYIPGTETCLQIGGMMRYEMRYNSAETDPARDYDFWKFARLELTVDARNETEWGTLRGFGVGRFDWDSLTSANTSAYVDQVFIELQQAMGTLRIGKSDLPYARFLGYGTGFGPYGGSYGFRNSGEVSYTFTGGNGFSAIVAAVESGTGLFEPAVEAGVKFEQGWGSIGAIAAYDVPAEEWSAKAVARGNFGIVSVGAHVFYSSGTNAYTVGSSEWSVLAHANVKATDTVSVGAAVQWFDRELAAATADRWQITGAIDWKPVAGLRIRPEVRYTTEVETWEAAIRFDRSF